MKARALAAGWLLLVSGCVGPLPYLSGPAIRTSLIHVRGSYRANYYVNEAPVEGSALVAVVAADPEAHAKARSGRRQFIAGRAMALNGGLSFLGLALSAGIVAGTWRPADPDRVNSVASGLAFGAVAGGVFGLAIPGLILMYTAQRRTEDAVSLYNQHAAAH